MSARPRFITLTGNSWRILSYEVGMPRTSDGLLLREQLVSTLLARQPSYPWPGQPQDRTQRLEKRRWTGGLEGGGVRGVGTCFKTSVAFLHLPTPPSGGGGSGTVEEGTGGRGA